MLEESNIRIVRSPWPNTDSIESIKWLKLDEGIKAIHLHLRKKKVFFHQVNAAAHTAPIASQSFTGYCHPHTAFARFITQWLFLLFPNLNKQLSEKIKAITNHTWFDHTDNTAVLNITVCHWWGKFATNHSHLILVSHQARNFSNCPHVYYFFPQFYFECFNKLLDFTLKSNA